MKVTNTLIKKFLENRCNAAEAAAVARYLKKHPELMTGYLRSSWDEAGRETGLPPGYKEEMLEAINRQIGKRSRIVRFRWFAAAASVIVLLTAVWFYRPGTKTAEPTPATVTNAAVWRQHINTTAKVYSIQLHDGSVIKLAPKAVIKYQEPFENNKRNIYLEGEADFDVAHDKTRPFTVYTKLFATTALGTSFRVSETAAGCTIKLFTGKVIIKGWKQDIILSPGEEMKYNLAKRDVTVERFHAKPRLNRPSQSMAEAGDKLVFDNTPLTAVMKALKKKYQLPIEYEEDLLTGKYFSGEVLQGDSLSLILKVIANMNGLQVTEKDNGFIISHSN